MSEEDVNQQFEKARWALELLFEYEYSVSDLLSVLPIMLGVCARQAGQSGMSVFSKYDYLSNAWRNVEKIADGKSVTDTGDLH